LAYGTAQIEKEQIFSDFSISHHPKLVVEAVTISVLRIIEVLKVVKGIKKESRTFSAQGKSSIQISDKILLWIGATDVDVIGIGPGDSYSRPESPIRSLDSL
jgi:hypothetical protein